jgi:hypothetical protein
VLWRSRLMHGLGGEGKKGADELQCRTRPWNGRERWRASAAFDRKAKRNGGGGPVRAAPHGGRRKGVNPVAPHGGEHGGLVGSDAGKGVDTTDATAGQKRGAGWRMWATRWRTWANRGRRDLGRARENSAVLQLIQDFQTEQELIRSKTGFSLIKNL